jgi:hypothetical protein
MPSTWSYGPCVLYYVTQMVKVLSVLKLQLGSASSVLESLSRNKVPYPEETRSAQQFWKASKVVQHNK